MVFLWRREVVRELPHGSLGPHGLAGVPSRQGQPTGEEGGDKRCAWLCLAAGGPALPVPAQPLRAAWGSIGLQASCG